MATGKTHQTHARAIATTTLFSWVFIPFVAAFAQVVLIFVPVGSLLGYIITPDRDFDHFTTAEEHRAIQRWGLLGHFWIFWWNAWAYRMSHRHWLSHAPVVSTLGRMLYLVCPPAFCILVDFTFVGRRVTVKEHLKTFVVYAIYFAVIATIFFLSEQYREELSSVIALTTTTLPFAVVGVFVGWLLQDIWHLLLDGWKWHSRNN